jgi:hypothetical protein
LRRYQAHGYLLDTDLRLDGLSELIGPAPGLGGSSSSGERLTLVRGPDAEVPPEVPPGRTLARLQDEELRTYYSFGLDEAAARLVLRFHGAVEVRSDPALTRGTLHLHPGADPGLLQVLLSGTVLAARLILDGRLTLHASALRTPIGVVAFVGSPGMGKSTLAGLGMAAGFGLVTDDVLRVESRGGRAVVWPAATEVRLRTRAANIAQLVAGRVRHTADQRLALSEGKGAGVGMGGFGSGGTQRGAGDGSLPLAAVVIPRPRREFAQLSLHRLEPFDAFGKLAAFPRIMGWQDPATVARQFDQLGGLCEQVPVYTADLPWGPPFDPALIPGLLARIAVS